MGRWFSARKIAESSAQPDVAQFFDIRSARASIDRLIIITSEKSSQN